MRDLVKIIRSNLDKTRKKLRNSASEHLPAIPPYSGDFTYSGEAWVESVQGLVEFRGGNSDYFYLPASALYRTQTLEHFKSSRAAIFGFIGDRIQPSSLLLNIGAGTDATPINTFVEKGHKIVSVDYAEDLVSMLRETTSEPAFAFDLQYLSKILPKDSFDYAIGNSVLGYVESKKLNSVVEQLSATVKKGAFFSFDEAPHPSYFNMVVGRKKQRLINASAIDLDKLLEFIERYGSKNGLSAMAYYDVALKHSVHLAMLSIIKELFEKHAFSTRVGHLMIEAPGAPKMPVFTLRVARDHTVALMASAMPQEFTTSNIDDLVEHALTGINPTYLIQYIDRDYGSRLAKALEIDCDPKEAAWRVSLYANHNLAPETLPEPIKEEVINSISWKTARERILPYINGRSYSPPEPIAPLIAQEQMIHKDVIVGAGMFGELEPHQANALIDRIHENRLSQTPRRRSLARPATQKRNKRRKKKGK